MKSFEIITVTNRIPTESYYHYFPWLKSITRFGVEPTVLGMNEPWHGLMTKPRTLRKWLRDGKNESDNLIVVDSFDIIMLEHPQTVVDAWFEGWGIWDTVFNAERNIFPDGSIGPRFIDPGTPYRYLNSGFFIGLASSILTLLEKMDLDSIPDDNPATGENPCDQLYYQKAFLDHGEDLKLRLDTNARLCQTLHDVPEGELTLESGKLYNTLTKTFPLVAHGNGNGKDYLAKLIDHFGLR